MHCRFFFAFAFAPTRLHSISSGLRRNLVEGGGNHNEETYMACTVQYTGIYSIQQKIIELGDDDLREVTWNTWSSSSKNLMDGKRGPLHF